VTRRLLITGGAGFIGSTLVRDALARGFEVVDLDALTYAGHLESLAEVLDDPRHVFVRGDVAEPADVDAALARGPFDGVLHLAAESHVDRSIQGPQVFMRTNVLGTFTLLERLRHAAAQWPAPPRVVHVGTDEVYGSLGPEGAFHEDRRLEPTSPYAASKASGDLVALSFFKTYGLPVMVTRCCNNYGLRQLPEKLIPLMITRALAGEALPVYGDGQQRRQWLHVGDHAAALLEVLERGAPGRVYNVGGGDETANIDVVRRILEVLGRPESLIRHVRDRLAHDRRYALDDTRLRAEIGWAPRRRFAEGLEETVHWYVANQAWCRAVQSEAHEAFQKEYYAGR
jgi:dTDP-glucose 4,6-dehydratase